MFKNIQDDYLNNLLENHLQISVYLINGIKLSGVIAAFDSNVIILSDSKSTVQQLIYKHAVSTIVPARVN